MRLTVAAPVVLLVGLVLAACGPAPQREWPIWTYGGIYNGLSSLPQPGTR